MFWVDKGGEESELMQLGPAARDRVIDTFLGHSFVARHNGVRLGGWDVVGAAHEWVIKDDPLSAANVLQGITSITSAKRVVPANRVRPGFQKLSEEL